MLAEGSKQGGVRGNNNSLAYSFFPAVYRDPLQLWHRGRELWVNKELCWRQKSRAGKTSSPLHGALETYGFSNGKFMQELMHANT